MLFSSASFLVELLQKLHFKQFVTGDISRQTRSPLSILP